MARFSGVAKMKPSASRTSVAPAFACRYQKLHLTVSPCVQAIPCPGQGCQNSPKSKQRHRRGSHERRTGGIHEHIYPGAETIRQRAKNRQSSCSALVAMMKPACFWNFNDPANMGRLDLSRFRRILVQSEMTAAIVIIGEIGSKSCPKRCLVNRNDVIEALSADRSNQALDIGCLPGRSGCS
jgi:hypothetical protein